MLAAGAITEKEISKIEANTTRHQFRPKGGITSDSFKVLSFYKTPTSKLFEQLGLKFRGEQTFVQITARRGAE